jgi:uncharacterized protein DUF1996
MRMHEPTRAGRFAGVLLAMLLMTLLYAGVAEAEPRIKTSGCKIYDTNQVDPIASASHVHHHFGNTSTSNQSTRQSLSEHKKTSCSEDSSWFTSAGWFPVERNEPVIRVGVYYRAPGDQTEVRRIPRGLELLGTQKMYNCNDGRWQDSPVYSCRDNWAVSVKFPDCWNEASKEETTMVYSRNGDCPRTHPYRIPHISYLIQHDNPDNVVANPLMVSAGVNEWHPYSSMHADYLSANQPVFNRKLIGLCLRSQPDNATADTLPDKCG